MTNVSGTVFAADGTTPVPAASVNATPGSHPTITTDAAGHYVYPPLTDGLDYVMHAHKDAHVGSAIAEGNGGNIVVDIVLS